MMKTGCPTGIGFDTADRRDEAAQGCVVVTVALGATSRSGPGPSADIQFSFRSGGSVSMLTCSAVNTDRT
jgi:hypothetical protein